LNLQENAGPTWKILPLFLSGVFLTGKRAYLELCAGFPGIIGIYLAQYEAISKKELLKCP
jgi:hypothetical protein